MDWLFKIMFVVGVGISIWLFLKMREFVKVLRSWAYEVAEHLDLVESA